jgi:predicted amidophosphoribosyltransferase
MPAAKAPTCMRCQQPLSKGSGFCLSCGFQNEADSVHSRQLEIDNKLESRSARFRFLSKLLAFLGIARRL